jgi:hypothetical protein
LLNLSFSTSVAGGSGSPRGSASTIDRKIREAIGEGHRESRADENPVLAIHALEVAGDLVKL